MHRLTPMKYRFGLTPLEQLALEIIHILHFLCHFCALWQRSAQVRVVARIRASGSHRILIAIKHLRNTAHSGQKHICQLHTAQIFVFHYIRNTCHVVVAKESEQLVHIGIHIIHGHGVIDAGQTIAPSLTVILQCLTDCLFYREIHYSRQVRIKAVEVLSAALPISYSRSGTRPTFAYNIDIRVLFTDCFEPLTARNLLYIRVCIHAQTV